MTKPKKTQRAPRGGAAQGFDASDPADAQAPTAETPAPAEPAAREPRGKIGTLITLLRREEGADIETMMEATGWQPHSVRGALSGAIKKERGLAVVSEKIDGARRYRITPEAGA